MINSKTKLWACLVIFLIAVGVCAQDHRHSPAGQPADKSHANCPMMQPDKSSDSAHSEGHTAHLDDVNARGEKAMGFSQNATTHHFLLSPEGGIIQVETNEPNDKANRQNIREHLKHIAAMFGAGNFNIPMLVHNQVPPGVMTMEQLKGKITFAYEETGQGGRVRISTTDREALAAVHEFLRFQIKDHQTGDSLEMTPR
ncbi:MAG: hypothetical protein V7641_869 [Blastocatellia bacterium]